LMQEKRVPAQQMAMMCERTMVNGLQWALGINLE
jgi:hypothetical protein